MVDCLTGALVSGEGGCEHVSEQNVESFLLKQREGDRNALFSSPKFSDVSIIPAGIGRFMLDTRPESLAETSLDLIAEVELAGMQQSGLWLHSDATDPQILFRGSCFDPQSIYLLRLQLEFPEPQVLMTYTPGPGGGYKPGGRDTLEMSAGAHWVYLLIRGLDCDSHVRLDPLQRRGDMFLRKVLLDRVGAAGSVTD